MLGGLVELPFGGPPNIEHFTNTDLFKNRLAVNSSLAASPNVQITASESVL